MNYLQTALKVSKNDREQEEKIEQKIILVQKGTPEGRRKNLELVMDSIMLSARDWVIKLRNGKQTILTDEINAVEGEIERLKHEVLNGKANLSDFQVACDRWVASHSK